MGDVCVLGLGLIGGSVLRAVSAAGWTAWAATASDDDAAAASAAGFTVLPIDDALRRASDTGAVVVVAVSLDAINSVLDEVGRLAPACVVTDVGGIKQPIAEHVAASPTSLRYVGGHPMAGKAESGWPAGSATLFDRAAWAVCVEPDTDRSAWAEVANLALATGAEVVPVTARRHDDAVARISHLPHLLAAVLASAGAQGGPLGLSLAAGSFTDGTRVAGSDPNLVRAMTEGNRSSLLPALDGALGTLGAARGSLASTGSLAATINAGHAARDALQRLGSAPRVDVRIDLSASDSVDALLGLGERGGRITAIADGVATGYVPDDDA